MLSDLLLSFQVLLDGARCHMFSPIKNNFFGKFLVLYIVVYIYNILNRKKYGQNKNVKNVCER